MKKLKTVVIGLGRIGWQTHVPEVAAHLGFKLIAAVDPLPERLAEFEKQYGGKGYTGTDALYAAERPDLVVVASPTPFHPAQTIQAFQRGCDVFCDKPVAPDLRETDRMIRAMKKYGRKFMVYQPRRLDPEFLALQDILSRELIGQVYMIHHTVAHYTRRDDWQAFKAHGGGMLNNYGAHYVDQLLRLAGSPVRRVSCCLRTIASLGDADDVVRLTAETRNDIILDLHINMACACALPSWYVLGSHGAITQDGAAWRVRYVKKSDLPRPRLQKGLAANCRKYDNTGKIAWKEKKFPFTDYSAGAYYGKCYDYFARNKAPFVPISETREVMRVLHEARRSAGGK